MKPGDASTARAPLLILIPEFPGQTHNFFWREVSELESRGTPVQLVSTRLPPPRLASPAWAAQAIARTEYLAPPTLRSLLGAAATVLRAGPAAWWRCLHLLSASDIQGLSRRARLLALVLLAGRLCAIARAAGARHVHVHSCADAANLALFAHALGGPSYSLTLHGALGGYGDNQRAKWRHAAFALVVSETLCTAVRSLLGSALPARVAVAPMGVDVAFFQRSTPYQPWVGSGPLRLFSCARLNRHKGHACAIAMLHALVAQGVDAWLVVAGEDDQGGAGYRRELEALIRVSGVAERITLLGAVPAIQVREELLRAHAFLLLSEDEALGVAYMEAMAMELPVLGCRVGGVPELIEDGVHGRLVLPAQALIACGALLEMLADPAAARAHGVAGRAQVLRAFGSARSAEVLLSLLDAPQAARRTSPTTSA
jgi:glycosyltransferase involved in cell wall biosynthesis